MENILRVNGVYKSYKQVRAVNGISFDVAKGEIFGLIGPNGAGKTTTLRMVATLLKTDGGDISVGGYSVKTDAMQVRRMISYLPEEAGAYKTMTGEDYLTFMASVFFTDPQQKKKRIAYAKEICGLGVRIKDRVGQYSKGMVRKLMIARAMMSEPQLAILDEPTSGLDVLNALEVRKLIKSLAGEGVTFLISGHNMLEIEYVSDRVGIMHKGDIKDTGTPKAIKEKYGADNLEQAFSRVVEHNE